MNTVQLRDLIDPTVTTNVFAFNNHDTLNSHRQYQEISNDMEHYIEKRHPGDKEFNEVYTDLFVIKRKYLDKYQVNMEAERLVNIYPGKRFFFDVLKNVE